MERVREREREGGRKREREVQRGGEDMNVAGGDKMCSFHSERYSAVC